MKAPTANVCVNLPDGAPGAPFTELAAVPKDPVQLFPAARAGTGDQAGLHGSAGTLRGNANAPPITTKAMGLRCIGLCGRARGPGHSERQRRNSDLPPQLQPLLSGSHSGIMHGKAGSGTARQQVFRRSEPSACRCAVCSGQVRNQPENQANPHDH